MTAADPPAGEPGSPAAFTGLVVPARGRPRLTRVRLAPRYADFTAGTGDPRGWPRPVKWVDTINGAGLAWCGERRNLPDLPDNPAALTIAARLGCADLADRIGLRGDLLLAGIDSAGGPADVPAAVLLAAVRAGLLTTHELDLRRESGPGAAGTPTPEPQR